MNEGRKNSTFWIRQIVLTIFALIMLAPFVWLVLSSFKSKSEIESITMVLLPKVWRFDNYIKAMKAAPFGLYFFNSAKVTVLRIIGALLFNSMAAYAFAKMKFPGRDKVFLLYIATMMVPPQVTLIPSYIIMAKIGWVNTHLPLWVPLMFMPYFVFMLRQFFVSIPDSLIEAAKIDGAGAFRTFFVIIMPLAKPAYVSMAIIMFIWSWNNIMTALIYLNSERLYTIPLGMGVFKGEYSTELGLLFAASVIALLPIIVIYMIGQKNLQEGLATDGIKG